MDRKTIFAFVLIGIVIVAMPYYFQLINPEPPAPAESPATSSEPGAEPTTPPPTAADPSVGSDREPTLADAGSSPTVAGDARRSGEDAAPIDNIVARDIRIETPLYTAVFSTRGATVHSWRILPTKPYLTETEELVFPQFGGRNLTLTALGGLGLLRTGERVFEVEGNLDGDRLVLEDGGGPDSLVFTLPLGDDRWYRETYVFHPDRFKVDMHIASRGLGATTGAVSAILTWGGGLATTEEDTVQDHQYTEAVWRIGSNHETLDGGKKEEEKSATGQTEWVGVRSKYFAMALVPDSPAAGATLRTWPDLSYVGKHRPEYYATDLSFNIPQGELDERLTLYLGPLEMEHLDRIDPTLDEMMSWGWPVIAPFSKGVFYVFNFLHRFIPNYGLVLILFAIMIKIVVWPLTYKSHKSMKRMQLIQPLMKELQEKYKDDPQRMQREVMGLYKEFKVNPMGGCWPMLLQMPLLYALFIVFRSTIELRHQPFMLWINDLSMPDALIHFPFAIPLYGDHLAVLPIVMAVTMYLQSKTTVTDPNQKMMTVLMPVMMIFIFNNFPSGLTLYYTMFNLLSWLQVKVMKTHDPALESRIAEFREEKEKELERKERRQRKKNRNNG